tara:strand:+ start:529 stop:1266 length:738 start_codon:yes stop_codon:yes gene_type:complete
MAISGAGQQKSFSDLQTEFGGSHPITMGEYAAFRVSGSGNTIDMDDFAGAVAFTWDNPSVDLDLPNNALVSTGSSSGTALGIAVIGMAYQPADNRIRFRYGKGTQSTAVTYSYLNLGYTGADPDSVEVQLNWTASQSGTGTFSNGSGVTSGNWLSVTEQSTSSDSGSFNTYIWSAQKTSSQGFGTAALDAGAFAGTALTFAFRAKDSSGNVIATSSTSNSETIYVSATRSGFGGGGPGGGGGFEP